ncbi:hypothetical protein [uncultured Clostridium sp.]|uniref:hypothetical protein n=1 Tax=uncultured Clostridium sp. TaxID=59620 RepID=UPI00262506B1|nr:hypothetical protein [uncultured Clostridium sp.]
MFRTFFKTSEIQLYEKMNMWIYYISKIPIIGDISENWYSKIRFKKWLSYFVRIVSFAFGIISKFLYIFFIVILPAIFIQEKTGISAALIEFQIFFFLSFIVGPIIDNNVGMELQKDFYMINLMRFNASEYYKSKIIYEYTEYLIYFIIPITFLDVSLKGAVLITILLILVRAIGQYMHLIIMEKVNFKLLNKSPKVMVGILGIWIITFGTPFIGVVFNFREILLSKKVILIITVLGVISLIQIFRYKKYNILAKVILSKSDMEKINDGVKDAAFMDVKINEKKINTKDLINDKYRDKEGIDYLNFKFMERHKRIIFNPIKRRAILFIGIFLIGLIGTIFFVENKESVQKIILSSSGFLVFVVYASSIGEKITKAFFFNCDNSLLRHKFYTEPKVILDNFKSRLKICIVLELIPVSILGIGLGTIFIASGGSIIEYTPIFISIITLGIFFAVHYLFLYYIAQPYTAQLKVKSPIYTFGTMVISIFAYICLQVRETTIIFTIIIIVLTVIYILTAITLVYKYSYKTFKLK